MRRTKERASADLKTRSAKIFLAAMAGGFLSVLAALLAASTMERVPGSPALVPSMRVFPGGEGGKFFRPNPEHRPSRREPLVKER